MENEQVERQQRCKSSCFFYGRAATWRPHGASPPAMGAACATETLSLPLAIAQRQDELPLDCRGLNWGLKMGSRVEGRYRVGRCKGPLNKHQLTNLMQWINAVSGRFRCMNSLACHVCCSCRKMKPLTKLTCMVKPSGTTKSSQDIPKPHPSHPSKINHSHQALNIN